jgi:uncharacterized protein YukE
MDWETTTKNSISSLRRNFNSIQSIWGGSVLLSYLDEWKHFAS